MALLFPFLSTPVSAGKPPPPPPPIPNSVCVDAGHGGSDLGAVNQELLEKDVNLQVAQLLKAKLETQGFKVFTTRIDDSTLSNADRYNYCNAQRAAILVSIHHNGSSNTTTDYSLGLYMKKEDKELAQTVVTTVSSQLGIHDNGITRFASGVLIKANMPATISEGFFLTNSNEYTLITTSDRLDKEASALFTAIQIYFNK